jgi:hypothetical protein
MIVEIAMIVNIGVSVEIAMIVNIRVSVVRSPMILGILVLPMIEVQPAPT